MSRRQPVRRHRHVLELERLEEFVLLSASFDIVGLTAARADPMFSGINGKGIGIVNIDTGVDGSNPEIAPNLVYFYNAVTDQGGAPSTSFDHNGHGTHTAGISSSSNPEIGVAPHATLIGIHALLDPGESVPRNVDPVARALQWVINSVEGGNPYNIQVVNMSLGQPGTNYNSIPQNPNAQGQLIQRLQNQDHVSVIVSSGNDYASDPELGASLPAVYATLNVANTWADSFQGEPGYLYSTWGGSFSTYAAVYTSAGTDQLNAGSQRSSLGNQVAAPGTNIVSTWTNGQLHNTESGTSMAAPLVTGMVALIQQVAYTAGGRYLTPTEVHDIVRNTADKLTDPTSRPGEGRLPIVNSKPDYNAQPGSLPGTGATIYRVNALKALQATRQLVTQGGGGGGGGTTSPDTNSRIKTAIAPPQLDGNVVYDFPGNIGRDGQVQVGANDIDLFTVKLVSPGRIGAMTGHLDGSSSNVLTYLRLFDRAGNELDADAGSAGGGYSFLFSDPLPAGTYYIGVSGLGNYLYDINTGGGVSPTSSTGDYRLKLYLQNPDPNGVITGAKTVASLPDYEYGIIGSDPPPANSSDRIQVGPGDVDMFKVTAPDTGELLIEVYAQHGQTSFPSYQALYGYIRVFDASGRELDWAEPDDSTGDPALSVSLKKGDVVYVAISDLNNWDYNAKDPYDRVVDDWSDGDHYELLMAFDNHDQNGSIFTAASGQWNTTLTSIVGSDPDPNHPGQRILVGADGSQDVDFVKITAPSTGLLDVTAVGQDGFVPALGLWIFDEQASTARQIAKNANDSTQLIAPVKSGQTYYVSVTGQGNQDFLWYWPATGTGGQAGTCTFTITMRSQSDLVALSDNQAVGHAQAVQKLAIGVPIGGNIGMDGNLYAGPDDVDIYQFVPTVTQTYDIRTDTSQEGSADTFLRVFDANGNELAYNDNAGTKTIGSAVRLSLSAGQTYYIGVNGAGPQARSYNALTGAGAASGRSTGNYVLSVNAVRPTGGGGGNTGGGGGNTGGGGGNTGGGGSTGGGGNTGGASKSETSSGVALTAASVVKAKKGKSSIVLNFTGPLEGGAGLPLGSFRLTTIGKGKRPGKAVHLTSAVYDPTTHTITLTPKGKLNLKKPLRLTINGLSGGPTTLLISRRGATIAAMRADLTALSTAPARTVARPAALSAVAVDALFLGSLEDLGIPSSRPHRGRS